MPKFVLVHADDWAGLYVDGYLVYENHSIRGAEVLDYVEGSEVIELDYQWMYDEGHLPESYEDIPDEVKLYY